MAGTAAPSPPAAAGLLLLQLVLQLVLQLAAPADGLIQAQRVPHPVAPTAAQRAWMDLEIGAKKWSKSTLNRPRIGPNSLRIALNCL